MYWILDPRAHRQSWREAVVDAGEDPVFGEVIAAPDPGELWICDLCNDPIDIRPIPVLGDYALCVRCWNEKFDREKPGSICSCPGDKASVAALADRAGVSWEEMARSLIVWYSTIGEPHVVQIEP